MRILLINPPYAASEPPRIPMGLLYVGAVLEEAGHEVKLLDLLVSKPTPERIRRAIEELDPAMVGITSVTMNYPDASAILKYIKEIHPSAKTVVGGPHATFCWEQIGREEPWVDCVVRGEGEVTVRDLAAKLEKGGDFSGIAGIAWRNGKDGGLTLNGERKLIEDLDSLPLPARHLFPISLYRALRMDAGLTSGRGCPFSCIFCVGPRMVGRKPRLRSPKPVVDELEDILRMGFESVALSDDHFAMNRRHAFAVCDEIISRGIEADLNIFVRADAVDEEILAKMFAAGCRKVLFGVESGVQEIVDRIKKRQNLEMLREKVKLTKSMGIDVQASFIMGLPGESPETLKKTFEYARTLGTFYGMHVLAPLPGSEIYEKAEEYGMTILHRDWSRYDANQAIASTRDLPAEELDRIAAEYDSWFVKMAEIEIEADRKGQLPPELHALLDRRRTQAFFWRLLRDDFIEDFRPSKDTRKADDAISEMAKQSAAPVGVTIEEATRWIKGVLDSGDLEWKSDEGRFCFNDSIYPKKKMMSDE